MRAPLTPLKAFLSDSERGQTGFGNVGDNRMSHWLSVAQAAERICVSTRNDSVEYAKTLSHSVLPPREQRPTQIEGDGREPSDSLGKLAERFRLEAEDMERAGCFELALVTVSSVCRALTDAPISQRLLATVHMGRVMRQMGDLDSAKEVYTGVATTAMSVGEKPIAAHGHIGLGVVAAERGNQPDQKAHYQKALELAPLGSPVERSSHQGLMVVAVARNDLADALLHGWRAHDLSPPKSDVQYEVIGNMARVAHEGGFFGAAKAGFEFVLQHSTVARIRIVSIGGAVRTAASLGLKEEALRYVDLGFLEVHKGAPRHDAARFYLWCAEAFAKLGDVESRNSLAERAGQIADADGFHEVRHRSEALLNQPTLSTTSRPSSQIAGRRPAFFESDSVRIGINRLEALAV
ncbi:MAG: hypothetical protein ABJB66_07610 [Gemmatimonadaceae bacterium]